MPPVPFSYRADPAVPPFPDDRPIIVFDGYCVMCSASARFLLRQDRRAEFRFLPAQTALGRALYVHYGLDPDHLETMMLIEDGVPALRSEGMVRAAVRLGFPWSTARLLRLLPLSWRDRLYELVARNRFRLFGRRDACYRPEPGQQARFLA